MCLTFSVSYERRAAKKGLLQKHGIGVMCDELDAGKLGNEKMECE